jgi:cytochrome c-type biogenesis protein CcmH/NrfG
MERNVDRSGAGNRSGKPIAFWALLIVAAVLVIGVSRSQPVQRWLLARKSLDELRATAETSSRDLAAWSLYAEKLLAAGKGEEAANAYEKAVSQIPESDQSGRARRILADGAYAAARYGTDAQAEAMVGRIANGPTDDLRGSLAVGIWAMRRKDFRAAQESFTNATTLDRKSAEAHSRLGTCLLAQGYPADGTLKYAAQLAPNDAAVQADLGESLAIGSKFREAAEAYATAARLAPDNRDYVSQYAQASANAARTDEEYESAATLLVTALQASPDDTALYLTLAGLQMRFARMAEARRSYETAIGKSPDNPDAWFNLSTVYTRLGDRDSAAFARKKFQEILDRQTIIVELTKKSLAHPNDSALFIALSAAQRRAGDMQGAYRSLQRAAALDPANKRLQNTLEAATRVMGGGSPLMSGGRAN